MKARVLRKLLNDTSYIISNREEYISVGSGYVHNLIAVNKETLEITFALDHDRKGKASLKNKELLDICDKLEELIKSGEIRSIISENDIIENPLSVYHAKDGEIIETFTDEYGWPNNDHIGNVMYDNQFFKTRAEALQRGINSAQAWIESCERYAKELAETTISNNESLRQALIENEKYQTALDAI